MQGGSTSVISQPVSGFQAGTSYSVSFKAAQRGNAGQPGQDFDLYLDATLLGTFRPADTSYAQLSTAAFTTTAGAHTLKFVGRNTSGGDNTAFIDDVRLSVAPPTQSFVTGKTLGALRADYTGHVGMKIAVGAQALTVTSLGRIYVSGNAGTHTLKVVRASDNAVVASASLSMSGGISGQFKYAPLPSPVTLAANTTYYVVSMETAGGDTWYDYYGTVLSTMSVASVVSGIYGDGVNWGIAGGAGNCYVPVDFQYQSGGGTADVRWLVADQLGTPRMVVDKTGSLAGVRRHDYLPFGEEIAADATWRTTGRGYVGDAVRQKFTGYERDPETGLDYAQARYFASAQGRFTGADPLLASARPGAPQTWNRYAYTLNNPLRFVDPSGTVEGDAQQQATQQPTPQQPPSPNPQPAPSQDQRPTNVRIDGPQPSAGLNVPTADGQFFQGYGTNLRLTPTDQNGNSIPNVTVREEVNSTLTLNGVVAPTNTLQNPAPVTSPTGVVPDLVSHGVITPARVDEGSQATREGMRSILATPTTLTQVQWLFITTPTGRVGFTVYQRTLTNVGADGTVRPYTRLSEGNFTLNRPNSIPVAPMRILCPRF